MKRFEVYEEDKYGNTWMIAQFADLDNAEYFKKKMHSEDEAVKVRPIPVRIDVV